eukprot:CAMPEP_0177658990 /NCGR_PEP_ID=MMETSP0447-20121125/17182_1 /TAXON_ID=0 /ORGANISM="Stygamoeba regulata, Strain BSH-02190019" /LENGTH=419 /DNA_ID=CAMNT_0019163787 /DNA_START=53 /DNA_END=1309 /DNA_ORIENTATION=+
MADKVARFKQYEYRSNSNLVLTSDGPRAPKEPSGAPETLRGRDLYRMGDRVSRARPAELEAKLAKLQERKAKMAEKNASRTSTSDVTGANASQDDEASLLRKRGRRAGAQRRGITSVLDTEISDLRYVPKTRETRAAYEQLLAAVQAKLGDQPQDVLLGCGDEVLALLKDQRLNDPRRQAQLESLLGQLNVEEFAHLVRLGKAVVDYAPGDSAQDDAGGPMSLGDDALDNAEEIAVVFDEGSSDDEDQLVTVVGDSSDDEDEDETAGLADTEASQRLALARGPGQEDEDEDEDAEQDADGVSPMDQGGETTLDEGKRGEMAGGAGGVLQVRHVDGFWLQRQLAKFFKEDSVAAQQMADRVLEVLQLSDDRECENRLVQLLDYHRFDFIKLLLRNRALVLYCTLHGQAQGDSERAAVEAR